MKSLTRSAHKCPHSLAIPQFLHEKLKTTSVNTGSNSKGLFADFIYNGNTYRGV